MPSVKVPNFARAATKGTTPTPKIPQENQFEYPDLYEVDVPPNDGGNAPQNPPLLKQNRLRVAPITEEGRAVWVSRFDFRTADDVKRLVEKAANARFNQIWIQVRSAATAFYRSRIEPWDERLSGTLGKDPGWDPLAEMVNSAHGVGLEVHAWINVYPAWQGTTLPPAGVTPTPMIEQLSQLYGDLWKQWDVDTGPMRLSETYLYASPGHWAVQEHILRICRDLISSYYLDGIHLDHVRYASSRYSSDPITLARFAADKILEPELTQPEWQRRQITELVRQIHELIWHLKPGLLLSAAVWPVYRKEQDWNWWPNTDGYSSYSQDSLGWLRAGFIDVIAPMLYGSILGPASNSGYFQQVVQAYAEQANDGHVYAGIGADGVDAAEICRRIDMTRTAGLRGQAIFRANLLDSIKGWNALQNGPYQSTAVVPRPLSAISVG